MNRTDWTDEAIKKAKEALEKINLSVMVTRAKNEMIAKEKLEEAILWLEHGNNY